MARLRFLAVLATALLASGCGFNTALTNTMTMPPAGNGRNFEVGQLQARAAVVVARADGSASLSISLINPTDSALSVSAVNIGGVAATLTPTSQQIPANGVLQVGFKSDKFMDAVVALTPGTLTKVAIVLSDGSVGGTNALVVSDTGEYADVQRAPVPVVSPSPSPSASS